MLSWRKQIQNKISNCSHKIPFTVVLQLTVPLKYVRYFRWFISGNKNPLIQACVTLLTNVYIIINKFKLSLTELEI